MTTGTHILLTRFNLPSPGVEESFRAKQNWLTNRWVLFQQYCLPSVRAQQDQDFHWIIYFDPASPAWLREGIDQYEVSGDFVPIFRPAVSRSELLADIGAVAGHRGDFLVTTNLDNDDGLAADFTERIRSVPKQPTPTVIFLTKGLIRHGQNLYLRVDRDNAFPTVTAPWGAAETCWADWHTLLRNRMPVIELAGAPGWLQVVHGANVSNRVRGHLTGPEPYMQLFPHGMAGLEQPSAVRITQDRLIAAPTRAITETGRHAVKTMALSLFGKDGLDRVKAMLVARGRAQ